MAELGKGDARWIVNDLGAEGTNVNGWHWKEIDAMEWSKAKLQELMAGLVLAEEGGLKVTATGVDSCKGEAFINNRKAKLIPAYELEIALGFQAEEGGATAKGKIHLPYVADENHDEDPEVRFAPEAADALSSKAKSLFESKGKKVLLENVAQFVKELRAGGPALSSASTSAAAGAAAAASQVAKVKLSSAQPEVPKPSTSAPAAKPSSSASKHSSFSITEKFYARPADLYDCFTVEGKVKAFTQSPATIEPKPGGKFSWFNGSVTGEFTEMEANSRLVMSWRFSSWEDGCSSKVVVSLESPEEGTTILTIKQTGIPEEDKFGQTVIDNVQAGWKGQILNRIRQVFGYGVGM